MLNIHKIKNEIVRQMDAQDLRFNVESLEEAMEQADDAAESICNYYEFRRGQETEAVAEWLEDTLGNYPDFFVKINYEEIMSEKIKEWTGVDFTADKINDLVFAFSMDKELFEMFTKRVNQRAESYRAEREALDKLEASKNV